LNIIIKTIQEKYKMNFIYETNRIFAKDDTGKIIAEVTFPDRSKDVVEITHTFVDDSLRGKGVASKLLEAAAAKLRNEHKKAYPTCSYAVKWFENHPEEMDLYSGEPL
jgi:uncharacterized protein